MIRHVIDVGKVGEERERERLTSGGFVGHTEDGESIGALDVEDVAILRVGDVDVIVAWYLLQYLPSDRACVG